jgi:hypothetical protein
MGQSNRECTRIDAKKTKLNRRWTQIYADKRVTANRSASARLRRDRRRLNANKHRIHLRSTVPRDYYNLPENVPALHPMSVWRNFGFYFASIRVLVICVHLRPSAVQDCLFVCIRGLIDPSVSLW